MRSVEKSSSVFSDSTSATPNLNSPSTLFIIPKITLSNPVKNGIGFRAELQARGLGLNASNSWVLKSLDGDELEHLKTVDFRALSWQDDEHALLVRGTERCGLSVRFVNLTVDGRYCRFPRDYPMTYLSPRLLRAEPMTKRDFVASIANNPTIRIHKAGTGNLTGLLVGPRDAQYKSLVALVGKQLRSWLIEENPAPQFSRELTTILEDNPAEGEAIRARILALYS